MNCNFQNCFIVLILVLFSSCANETTFIEQVPSIGNCQFELIENSKVGTQIGKIDVDDASYSDLSFFLVKTKNSEAFSIDEKLGAIYLKDSLVADYELNSQIELELMISYKTALNDYAVFTEVLISIVDTIEENVIVLNSTKGNNYDGVVSSLNPTQSNFNHELLFVQAWTNDLAQNIQRAFIYFDLSLLPVGATITEAILYLYNPNDGNSEHEHSQLTGSNESIIAPISSNWKDDALSWNNQPLMNIEKSITVSGIISSSQNLEVDIFKLMNEAYKNIQSYYGIGLQLKNESYYRRLCFASMNNNNHELRPQLKITYLK